MPRNQRSNKKNIINPQCKMHVWILQLIGGCLVFTDHSSRGQWESERRGPEDIWRDSPWDYYLKVRSTNKLTLHITLLSLLGHFVICCVLYTHQPQHTPTDWFIESITWIISWYSNVLLNNLESGQSCCQSTHTSQPVTAAEWSEDPDRNQFQHPQDVPEQVKTMEVPL